MHMLRLLEPRDDIYENFVIRRASDKLDYPVLAICSSRTYQAGHHIDFPPLPPYAR